MKRKAQREPAGAALAPSVSRSEAFALLAIFAAGIALRVIAVSQSAVEHFDEGVYASNVYFGPPDYAYPQQPFYAPPLLPALIEAGMIAGLAPNVAALLPSLLAGCATIVAVWWFARSWFGPEVGLAGASLSALNDFHIAFSATALTDVLLGLWLVLAVDAIGRSLADRDFRWAIGAGIYTGLAWWTKYNGWLPLAIEAAVLPVLWFLLRPPRRHLLAWLGCLAVTCFVAAAVWSPYYFSLQASGGYAPIAANHARYVVGLSGWLDSARRQLASQLVLGSGWTLLGLVLAFWLPQLLTRRSAIQTAGLAFQSLLQAFVVSLLTVTLVLGIGAAVGVGRMSVALHRAPQLDASWRRRAVALALLCTWWGAMLMATPLYAPYARLTLPLILALWLATALNWSPLLGNTEEERPLEPGRAWGCGLALVWFALLFVLQAAAPHDDHLTHTGDRRGLVRIAEQIRATDIRHQPRVVYVYGEPALYFQLRAAGEPLAAPVQTVPAASAAAAGQPIPTFLVAGPHANRDPQFQEQWSAAMDLWQLVGEYDYEPSPIVWLDLNDPRQSPASTAELDSVRLYRLRP